MSACLITGGAGFVGSHLAEALLARGHWVTVIDDLSSGDARNLDHLVGNPRYHFVKGRITDERLLFKEVESCDIIFHLAAAVGVFNILDRPVQTIENNVGGTDVILRAATNGHKKVILASTSEVYGKSSAKAFREDGDLVLGETTKSRWSYAASKIIDEFMALAYWREYHVPIVVARLFNTIGPRQSGRYGMVVPRFIRQALAGQALSVYGTGRQSRCFTYVSDVVEWLCMLMEDDRAVGQVYNLGNPSAITIENLARKVIKITDSKSHIEYVPYDRAYEDGFEDIVRRKPDISKVVALTGRSPAISLEKALCLTRDWFLEESAKEAAPRNLKVVGMVGEPQK